MRPAEPYAPRPASREPGGRRRRPGGQKGAARAAPRCYSAESSRPIPPEVAPAPAPAPQQGMLCGRGPSGPRFRS